MTGSRGLSPHSALSPFPLETDTCTLDSVVECCKPIAYSHILAIIIFQVKIWSCSGSSCKTIAAPEWASASILTQTPVRGGALVLLGIFDPADGSSLQKAGDLNDCAADFAPRSDHGAGHVLQIIVPEKDAPQVIDNEVDRPVAGIPELVVIAATRRGDLDLYEGPVKPRKSFLHCRLLNRSMDHTMRSGQAALTCL